MAVSKQRKNHKAKANNFKLKLKERKKTLEKLYIEKINEMIINNQNKSEVK